jgi:hypothetical protein
MVGGRREPRGLGPDPGEETTVHILPRPLPEAVARAAARAEQGSSTGSERAGFADSGAEYGPCSDESCLAQGDMQKRKDRRKKKKGKRRRLWKPGCRANVQPIPVETVDQMLQTVNLRPAAALVGAPVPPPLSHPQAQPIPGVDAPDQSLPTSSQLPLQMAEHQLDEADYPRLRQHPLLWRAGRPLPRCVMLATFVVICQSLTTNETYAAQR